MNELQIVNHKVCDIDDGISHFLVQIQNLLNVNRFSVLLSLFGVPLFVFVGFHLRSNLNLKDKGTMNQMFNAFLSQFIIALQAKTLTQYFI